MKNKELIESWLLEGLQKGQRTLKKIAKDHNITTGYLRVKLCHFGIKWREFKKTHSLSKEELAICDNKENLAFSNISLNSEGKYDYREWIREIIKNNLGKIEYKLISMTGDCSDGENIKEQSEIWYYCEFKPVLCNIEQIISVDRDQPTCSKNRHIKGLTVEQEDVNIEISKQIAKGNKISVVHIDFMRMMKSCWLSLFSTLLLMSTQTNKALVIANFAVPERSGGKGERTHGSELIWEMRQKIGTKAVESSGLVSRLLNKYEIVGEKYSRSNKVKMFAIALLLNPKGD